MSNAIKMDRCIDREIVKDTLCKDAFVTKKWLQGKCSSESAVTMLPVKQIPPGKPRGEAFFLNNILSHNSVVRGYAERNAINAPIQGSAADIIKVAMVRIYRRFMQEGIRSKMILQVHDELNFSVLPEEKELVQQIVIEEMQGAYSLRVPLEVDCGWGANRLEAH